MSNSNDLVRDGAKNTLTVIMNKLTAHDAVSPRPRSQRAWREREPVEDLEQRQHAFSAITLHNALRSKLSLHSQIVESITEALSDPHPKVKDAAKQAMADVSGSIRNPELGRISGSLVGALSDPANKTKVALDALLQCEFSLCIQ